MFAEPCHYTGGKCKRHFSSFTDIGKLGKKGEDDVEERNEE